VDGWTEPTLSQLAVRLMTGSAALQRATNVVSEDGVTPKSIGQLIVDALGDKVNSLVDGYVDALFTFIKGNFDE
jgi:hypothetical protein